MSECFLGFSGGAPGTPEKGRSRGGLAGSGAKCGDHPFFVFISFLPAAFDSSAELMKSCSSINSVFG